jgi:F0F1-type ATP synthase gamma subunit
MALELVMGKKFNGVSIVFIMFFVSWILVHFITSLLFKKKNLPPCEPFLPLSSSNIVSYLELASNTLQLVTMENHKVSSIRIFYTNFKNLMFQKLQLAIAGRLIIKG